MFDTHFHLDPEDPHQEIYTAARDAGVYHMTLIGCDPESCERAQKVASLYENMFFSAGVHPLFVKELDKPLEFFDKFYSDPKNKAVGEIGLDFYYDKEPDIHAKQDSIFRYFLNKSKELKKPAIIHSREAFQETLNAIEDVLNKEQDFILHCYTGDKHWVKKFLDAGAYISYSGIVTFKNAKDIQESLAYVPDDRILIETDSPYLALIPMRGKRNQPAYVQYVCSKVAELKTMSAEELASLTTKNAKNIFGL